MSSQPTMGERLLSLKEHAGLSLSQIAKRGSYQGASSIQKLFKKSYNPPALPQAVADRLAVAFAGLGSPGIDPIEVLALAKDPDRMDRAIADLHYYSKQSSKYVGIFRTKRIASFVETEKGDKTPLFIRQDENGGMPYHDCPEHLRSHQLIAMHLTIGNMWPRFEEGELIIYEYGRPPLPGDDVVVTMVDENHLDGGMVVGRLYVLHEQEVQLDQLSPPGRIVLPRSSVISIRRIMRPVDMLPPQKFAPYAERID